MVIEHFKLDIQPFGVTPDPRFLYLSGTHREAMASLLHGIRSGRGFTALIAPPGMGKTTLLFNLLHLLEEDTKTAFLFQTLCGPGEFLNALLADLGIDDDGKNITRMHTKLNEYLFRESYYGRQVVVIIDEAQNLDEQVLEVVRMLSNFETANKKLLHVVLAGQPQLAEKLSSGGLIQLRQRISIVARLDPLNAHETREYIECRLKLAGHASGKPLFTKQAYMMIAEQSRGIPRNINNLCFNAMSLGCALNRPIVDGSMVREIFHDLDLRTIAAPPEKRKKSGEESSRPSHFSGRVSSSAKWRQEALLATAALVALLWIIPQVVGPAREQFLSELTVRTEQPKTSRTVEMAATSRAFIWETRKKRVLGSVSAKTTKAPGSKYELQMTANRNTPFTSMVDAPVYARQSLNEILELNPLLKEMEHLQQMRTTNMSRRQAIREIQSSPEHKVVPFEFAALRETQ